MKIGLHASHEQFPPSRLLALASLGADAGFDFLLSSDHFHPWSLQQGQSGLLWAWLGAAMSATGLGAGVVCAPGQRWHPAIVAQAAATLAQMFPGKFWIALGSGQLLNEGITGDAWPPKAIRRQRLMECVEIIRALWAGRTVTHRGLVRVEEATLFTLPPSLPMMYAAALSADTARWAASWADGLITVSGPDMLSVINAFREGGGGEKPIILKVQLSYAPDMDQALEGAVDQWRAPTLDGSVQTMLRRPEQFDAAVRDIPPSAVARCVRVSNSIQQHVDWLGEDEKLGVDSVVLHNVNPWQEQFVEVFGRQVLPRFIKR
jgi:coenzyme F420-dependent glucose-6-phosphate dehydrogenase